MTWYVLYVKDCRNSLKSFKSKQAAFRFIHKFVSDEDNWCDLVFSSAHCERLPHSGIYVKGAEVRIREK